MPNPLASHCPLALPRAMHNAITLLFKNNLSPPLPKKILDTHAPGVNVFNPLQTI